MDPMQPKPKDRTKADRIRQLPVRLQPRTTAWQGCQPAAPKGRITIDGLLQQKLLLLPFAIRSSRRGRRSAHLFAAAPAGTR